MKIGKTNWELIGPISFFIEDNTPWFYLFLTIENDVIIIDDININWKFHEASVNAVTFWEEESIVLFFLSHKSKEAILKAHTDFYCELFFFT